MLVEDTDHNLNHISRSNARTAYMDLKKNINNKMGLKCNCKTECNNSKNNSKNTNTTRINKIRDSSCNIGSNSKIIKTITKTKLSCMYFNARSIVNKVDELEIYTKEEELDIIGITETWLTDEILTSEISLEGYTLYRKDRKDILKQEEEG